MARLTPLSLEQARGVLAPLGVVPTVVEALEAGSVNSNFACQDAAGQRYFLRVYEEQGQAGARAELELLSELEAAGVPVAPSVRRQGRLWLGAHAGKPVALFPWVPGDILCQMRVDPAKARQVGQALARVHLAKVSALPEGRFAAADLLARLERVEAESTALAPDARMARDALQELSRLRSADLPQGLVHGDLFRDNVLWQQDRISALLDFESASRGPLIYDLCVCVHAWCYGDHFVPALVRALGDGYQAERPLTAAERAAFSVEARAAALRFVATRMTDYSLRAPPGKPPLRDYRRFVARAAVAESGELAGMLGI